MLDWGNLPLIGELILEYTLISEASMVQFSVTPSAIIRSSHPEVFLRKAVLKICSKFTGEHPCWSAISIKLQNECQFLVNLKRCFMRKGGTKFFEKVFFKTFLTESALLKIYSRNFVNHWHIFWKFTEILTLNIAFIWLYDHSLNWSVLIKSFMTNVSVLYLLKRPFRRYILGTLSKS